MYSNINAPPTDCLIYDIERRRCSKTRPSLKGKKWRVILNTYKNVYIEVCRGRVDGLTCFVKSGLMAGGVRRDRWRRR